MTTPDRETPERLGPRGLVARLGVRRGAFELDLALDVAAGETVALLGPNGAGKTTALRALAGLERSTGSIRLDGARLDGVPTEARPIAVVFQDYLLFAHLTALDNVAFGPRARGASKAAARELARAELERVGLADLAGRKPRALSGGQAQRVALARATVTRPRLLLLDEPLAALDASTRLAVRGELRRRLAAFDGVTVLVTHDPLDAMVLADRIVVLEHGHVVQDGAPADVAQHPRTEYVARLVGLNLHRGTAATTADGVTVALADGSSLVTASPATGPVLVAFAPAAVALHPQRPRGSARNVWRARVTAIEQHGATTRLALAGPPDVHADVTPAAVADLDLAPGAELWAAVKATEIRTYPA